MDNRFNGVPDTPREVRELLQGAISGYSLVIEPIIQAADLLVTRHDAGADENEIGFHIDSLRAALKGH